MDVEKELKRQQSQAQSRMQRKYAYSKLAGLMNERGLSVVDVVKLLKANGHNFNRKTLYRFASDKPLPMISAPVLGAVCEGLKVEVGRVIGWRRPAPKLLRIDSKTQERLDYLMGKNTEGKL